MTAHKSDEIQDLASQCVRCGLCLPHCPTYRVGQEEPESPRGRIQMLAAFAKEELTWQPALQQHVDQCLSCGHCERVCPIPVSYEHLLVKGREALAEKYPVPWWKRIFIKIMEAPALRQRIYFLYNFLNLHKIVGGCTNKKRCEYVPIRSTCSSLSLRFLLAHPPTISNENLNYDSSARGEAKNKKVLLFPGCTGRWMGQKTFHAAKILLTQLGYAVVLPPKDWCCGALSAHAGLGTKTTEKTFTALADFCQKENIREVITFATGCGGWMSKASGWLTTAKTFKVRDIQEFLSKHVMPAKAGIQSSINKAYLDASLRWHDSEGIFLTRPTKIAIHSPCTQTNALKNADLSFDLLQHLPNVELIKFGEKTCCGAAGMYMFEHPKISDQLIRELLTPERLKNIDVIVTSNIGCQLQFQRFFRKQKINIPVLHPVEVCLQYVSQMNFNTMSANTKDNTAKESATR